MILFLKAQIRGGAIGDLLAVPVHVDGHTRANGTYVAPYTAVRHKAEPEPEHEKPLPCVFCGEPEHVEIHEMWGDHSFMLETCCEALHDQVVRDMAEDPEWATELLRRAGAEDIMGEPLRRVAYTNDGFGPVLLDWEPQVGEISRKDAMAFIAKWHRHNGPLPGDMFRAGIWNGHTLLGVVVVGFPTAQAYMPAFKRKELCEVRRLCVRDDLPKELTWRACSALYRYAAEEAKRRGFQKIITYTQRDEESGMSLRYARWKPEGETKGGSWNTPARPRTDTAPTTPKLRWSRRLKAA